MDRRAMFRFLAIALVCCGFATTARAQPWYRIMDLGVGSAGCSGGMKLNDSGNSAAQVIGASPTDETGTRNHPFFWSQQTGMIDLSPNAPNSSFPTACGINNDGGIVGVINFRGVLWTNGR